MTFLLRSLVFIVILLGVWFSMDAMHTLGFLKRENSRLRVLVGDFEVADPSLVYVCQVPNHGSSGEFGHWKYRIHFPKGYAPVSFLRYGELRADSPTGGQSGSSCFNSNPRTKASIESVSVSLQKRDGKWLLRLNSANVSCSTTIRPDLDFGWSDDFEVTTIGEPGEPPSSFQTDEPICLLRIRAKSVNPDSGMAPGAYVYWVPQSSTQSFERQIFGLPAENE